jgi:Uma2 family endonuclease
LDDPRALPRYTVAMAIRQPTRRIAIPDDDDWSAFNGVSMSEAEFVALDDAHETNLEYYDGCAWKKGLVDRNHRVSTGELDGAFWAYKKLIGGSFGPEGRVRLPNGRHVKPDTAFWLPGIPSGNDSLPTVVVETRSPNQTIVSQRRKCRMYREAGVPIAWLIDPIRRVVEVFEGDRDADPLPSDGVLSSPLLPGFELPIRDIWAALD